MTFYEIDGVRPVVDPTAFVHPQASVIGDVIVEAGAYVGPLASLRGDFGRIRVGAGANVQDGCVLHAYPGRDCIVGDRGHIGHGAVLHGCEVREAGMVGINAVVLDGAVVGENALVAANSLVLDGVEVPPASLFAGSPGQVVRQLDEHALAWKSNGGRVYRELAQRSLATLREVEPLAAEEPDRSRVSVGPDQALTLGERRRQD